MAYAYFGGSNYKSVSAAHTSQICTDRENHSSMSQGAVPFGDVRALRSIHVSVLRLFQVVAGALRGLYF